MDNNGDGRSGPILTGRVVNLHPQENYGFIKPDDGTENVYYYMDCCPQAKPGDRVSFEVLIRKYDGVTRFSKTVNLITSFPVSPRNDIPSVNGAGSHNSINPDLIDLDDDASSISIPPIEVPPGHLPGDQQSRHRPPKANRNKRPHPHPRSGSNSSSASFQGSRSRQSSTNRPPQSMNPNIVPLFPEDSNPRSNNSRRGSGNVQNTGQRRKRTDSSSGRGSSEQLQPQSSSQTLNGVASHGDNQNGFTQVGHNKKQKQDRNEGPKTSTPATSRTVDVRIKFMKPDVFIAEAVIKLPEIYKDDATVCIRRTLLGPFESLLEKGDILKVILGTQNTEKPFAVKAEVSRCSKLNETQFYSFMMKCASTLEDNGSSNFSESQAVFNLIRVTPIWEAALSSDYLLADSFHQVVKFLTQIANLVSGNEVKDFFNKIMSTSLFHPLRGTCVYFILSIRRNEEKIKDLKQFLYGALLIHAPLKCGRILKLLEEVCPKEDKFWIMALRRSLKSGTSKEDIGVLEWKELPLTPTVNEIMGDVLEDDTNLSSVPVGKAFPSNEHYFDTYVRLLREDCFFEIKTGIQKLMDGTLDHRDMNVYKNVEMLGYVLNDNGVNVLFQMKKSSNLTKKVLRKSDLQHGNLLCVSAFGSFKDPVWVTILMRDKEFNDGGKIRFLAELCSYGNQQKIYEVLQNFTSRSGQLFVVESPTYYRAYEPILSSLQNSDCDKFPFKEVVIDLDASFVTAPSYGIDPDQAITHLGVTLDSSQMLAVKHTFENQISIIQGPPGCGKTFLGVQIVRLLLNSTQVPVAGPFSLMHHNAPPVLNSNLQLPILVLTYKNHALDEFLLQVGESIGLQNVCRVGGRSDEPKLESVSLRDLKTLQQKTNPVLKSIRSQIMDLKDEFESVSEKLQKALKDLQKSSEINPLDFIRDHFSNNQLEILLKNAPHVILDNQAKFKTINEKSKISKSMLGTVINAARDSMKEIGIPDLKTALFHDENNDELNDLNTVVKYAFKTWVPKETFIKSIEKEFCSLLEENVENVQTSEQASTDNGIDSDDEEEERFVSFQSSFRDIGDVIKRMNTFSDPQKRREKALTLLPFAKTLCDNSSATILYGTDDVWTLSERCRLIALQNVLQSDCDESKDLCEKLYANFIKLCEQKFELEERYSAAVALGCKVVAMTITGASLHRKMIESLKPSVVIVEEAAEVLEPQLIAVLGPWVKHLVMIGDHKQLPPPVQCFKLSKDYHFDLSMMERLIKGGIPYVPLKYQNRMRPSLSKYLLDIYPDLMDGQRVKQIPMLGLVKSDIYFWNHKEPELKDRSVTNEEEACRAVKLAMFLITQNIEPRKITILSMYRGQTALVRRKLDDIQKNKEYKDWIPDTLKREENVQVHTVDMYQGDENDVVIVSLVRSNDDNKLGFVKLLNRRCVSQSRAKQAVVFIGNFNTISSGHHWDRFLKMLKEENFVGEKLPIKCAKHPLSEFLIKDSKTFPPKDFCQVKCEAIMPCNQHLCPKKCKPDHGHDLCMTTIPYFEPHKCAHFRQRECWEDPKNVLCKFPCPIKYSCGHPCTEKCEPPHQHVQCKELVTFSCRRCSNDLRKQCWRKEEEIKCKADVPYTCPVCKKIGEKECHEDVQLFKCWGQCIRRVTGCGHPCTRLCHQPCATVETCDHCIEIRRIENEKIRKLKLEENRKMLERAKEDLKKAENNPSYVFKRERLDPDDAEFIHAQDMVLKFIQPTHNWYPTISFIEKVTNLELSVKFFESVSQLLDPSYVTEKFHGTSEAGVNGIIKDGFRLPNSNGKNMYGDGVYLASDSSKSAQEMYTKQSNMLLLCRVALGKCKTVTKACNNMTGAKLKKEGYDSLYAKRDSKNTGGVLFDEFVVFDPYRVLPVYIIHYNKSAIPKLNMMPPMTTNNALALGLGGGYSKIELTNERAASNPIGIHYRSAAGCFYALRDHRGYQGPQQLKSIFYHSNAKLEAAFELEKTEMERKYPGQPESDHILAFHGTSDNQNIDKIVRENFRMDLIRRAAHGHGIYFSEFPDVSLGYAGSTMKLLLCKLLPGKSHEEDCRRSRLGGMLKNICQH